MTRAVRIVCLSCAVAGALAARSVRGESLLPSPPGAPRPAVPGFARSPGPAAATGDFASIHAGLDGSPSSACVGCHPDANAEHSHPVDVDYAAAALAAPGGTAALRPVEEVRARGVVLVDGKVACLSCHALASPWRHHLAIPAGATPTRAVTPGDPRTYEPGAAPAPPAPGADVSPRPLCLGCHAF